MKISDTLAVGVLLLPLVLWALSRQERPLPAAQSSGSDAAFAGLNLGPSEGKLAPDFLLRDIDGNTLRLHDYRGSVIIISFWATWCPSCRIEMPSMEVLHRELGSQGLLVLAVAMQESAEDVRPFYREQGLSFPALLDRDAGASELYNIWSLPTTFVIDKQGRVVDKVIGYRDWANEQSKEFFASLLNEPM